MKLLKTILVALDFDDTSEALVTAVAKFSKPFDSQVVLRRRELFYFRDEQGLEVDFLVPGRGSSLSLVACKASKTVTPAMAAPLLRLAEAVKRKRPKGIMVQLTLVHEAPQAGSRTQAVVPGVRALAWRQFLDEL
jgi:uncharacterized protein